MLLTGITDYGITTQEDRAFQSAFAEAKLGMSEAEVVDSLGQPDKQEVEFHLGQKIGFEKAYTRAKDSGASKFLFWNREIDIVYVAGIDRARHVVLLEKGGT